jgi:Fe-S cluster biogenesis protein NfuA
MDTKTTKAILIYTEQTPNPEAIKYVTNSMLYEGTADFKTKELADEWSPLAAHLFELPYVKYVYISQNFVSVTKEFNYNWDDIMLALKEKIKTYLMEDNAIINEGYDEFINQKEEEGDATFQYTGKDKEIVDKIKQLIEKYVKPAVEMDGGNIEFNSYEDGRVTVIMQGSCSGCPSSTVTLKSGIEGMLKRMIPEITEVVAVAG